MKNYRDLLLTGFHLAVWIGLYRLGLADQIQILALGLIAMAYFLVEWVQKSKTPARIAAILLGNGLVVFSLPALKTLRADDLLSGLLVVAFSLGYFLQFNAFRKSIFHLFEGRKKKWAACLLSALTFGITYLLTSSMIEPKNLLQNLPQLILEDPTPAAIITGVYGLIFLFTPNLSIVRNKK